MLPLKIKFYIFAIRHLAPLLGAKGNRAKEIVEERDFMFKKENMTDSDFSRFTSLYREAKSLFPEKNRR